MKEFLNVLRRFVPPYKKYLVLSVVFNILSVVLVGFFGVSKLIAPILNLLISVPVNFLLNKFWAFRTKEP